MGTNVACRGIAVPPGPYRRVPVRLPRLDPADIIRLTRGALWCRMPHEGVTAEARIAQRLLALHRHEKAEAILVYLRKRFARPGDQTSRPMYVHGLLWKTRLCPYGRDLAELALKNFARGAITRQDDKAASRLAPQRNDGRFDLCVAMNARNDWRDLE
jgi:hypothetical protein